MNNFILLQILILYTKYENSFANEEIDIRAYKENENDILEFSHNDFGSIVKIVYNKLNPNLIIYHECFPLPRAFDIVKDNEVCNTIVMGPQYIESKDFVEDYILDFLLHKDNTYKSYKHSNKEYKIKAYHHSLIDEKRHTLDYNEVKYEIINKLYHITNQRNETKVFTSEQFSNFFII